MSTGSLAEALAALRTAGAAAGVDAGRVAGEGAALTAVLTAGARDAPTTWAATFGRAASGFDAAASTARPWRDGPSAVLGELVAAGSPAAEGYARALAAVAAAACDQGEPSLRTIGAAGVVAAAQLRAVGARPLVSVPGATVSAGPSTPGPEGATGPAATPASPVDADATAATVAGDAAAAASGVVAEPVPPPPSLAELLARLDDLIGLDSVKREVREQAELLRIEALRTKQGLKVADVTRHLVFVGNPGTGKSTVARLVAGIYRALGLLATGQLVETERSGLLAGYLGQTAEKTQATITRALGGVLFIDEAYSLVGDQYADEAVATLVKAMEDHRDDFVVIVAGYPGPMRRFVSANPGLASRFRLTLEFADYSDDELVEIFERQCRDGDFTPGPGCLDVLRTILAATPRDEGFGNARFVRNVFEAAIVRQAWRLRDVAEPTVDQLRELTPADLAAHDAPADDAPADDPPVS